MIGNRFGVLSTAQSNPNETHDLAPWVDISGDADANKYIKSWANNLRLEDIPKALCSAVMEACRWQPRSVTGDPICEPVVLAASPNTVFLEV